MVQVRFGDQFDRAVHIAIGDGDQSGGAAGAGNLNGCGVVAGGVSEGVDLEWDIAGGSLSGEEVHDDRAGIGTAYDDGSATDFNSPEFILVNSGAVGGVCDVDGDSDVGSDSEGTGGGSTQSDFFLHSRDCDDSAGGCCCGDLSQSLHDDPDAGTVIHGNTCESPVAEFTKAGFRCDGVTNAYEGASFGF